MDTSLSSLVSFAAVPICVCTAVDGPNPMRSHYLVVDLLHDGIADSETTQSALLGTLDVDIDLTIAQGSGVLSANAPAGAVMSNTHTRITAAITRNGSSATQFAVQGAVIWTLPTQANGALLQGQW